MGSCSIKIKYVLGSEVASVLVTSYPLVASFTVHCHVILWLLRDN